MRVLLLSCGFFPSSIGGGEVQVLTLARALEARGHRVQVLAFEQREGWGVEAIRDSYEDIPVVRLLAPVGRSCYTRSPAITRWATQWLAEERIDLIHAFLWPHLLGVISAARTLGLPVVLTALEFGYFCRRFTLLYRGSSPCRLDAQGGECEDCTLAAYSPRHRRLARAARWVPVRAEMWLREAVFALSGSDLLASLGGRAVTADIERQRESAPAEFAAIITPSTIMREFFLAQRVPAEKLHVVPYAVDPPRDSAPEYRPEPGRLRAAFIGRLDPAKGLHVLLDAIRVLGPSANVRLDIWAPGGSGAPEYVASLKARTQQEQRIRWRGPLPRDLLSQVYRETDVVVIPSVWYENSPVVASEALAHGCPVICTETRGMSDLVIGGVNGLTFPRADATRLAACLASLAEEPARLAALRRGIVPPPSTDSVVERILDLYRRALETRGASPRGGDPAEDPRSAHTPP